MTLAPRALREQVGIVPALRRQTLFFLIAFDRLVIKVDGGDSADETSFI